MGQTSSAKVATRLGQEGGPAVMSCADCAGEGTCIPSDLAKSAFPNWRNEDLHQAYYDDIDREICLEGSISLKRAQYLAYKHCGRRLHKGLRGSRRTLGEAIRDSAIVKNGIRNEWVADGLLDIAWSKIQSALGFLDGDKKLFDFRYGTSLFGFVIATIEKEALQLLRKSRRDLSLDDYHEEAAILVNKNDEIAEAALGNAERLESCKIWIAAVVGDPELLAIEKQALMLVHEALQRAIVAGSLKGKQRQVLTRAVTIMRGALDLKPGYGVLLFGDERGFYPRSIFLAPIVTDAVAEDDFAYTNGSQLTKDLPKHLQRALNLLADDPGPQGLVPAAILVGRSREIRSARKDGLIEVGKVRQREEKGFSIKTWLGCPRIVVAGRPAGCNLINSGIGIAAIDGLFGCIPPDAAVLRRFDMWGQGSNLGGRHD